MRNHITLEAWCTAESEFHYSDIEKYARALLEDDKKEEDRSGGRQEAKKKKGENKLLLVFPFEVNEELLGRAAADLTELGGKLFGLEARSEAKSDIVNNKKLPSRTHYITICEKDKDRLRPGGFLDDTLVDFWMRW